MNSDNQCSKCGKAKQLFSAGSITQWLFTCSCQPELEEDVFVCASCGGFLNKNIRGDTSEWVLSRPCQCSAPAFLRLSEMQSQTITKCSLCSKPIATNQASMTQWIFGESRCSCQRPQPIERSLSSYYQPAFDYLDGLDEEVVLDLDESKFPLERYIPVREIGRGAAGVVYLCRDRVLSKKVALKTLLDLSSEQLISFQNEAKVTAKLDHPNIVSILDFNLSEHDTPYMVMEYIAGISLDAYIAKNGPFEAVHAKDILLKLASALEYAHGQGVFHRDLKPGNILVQEEDEGLKVCLLDFGIAKVKEYSGYVTQYQNRTLAGTPSYMSPDQAQGLEYDATSEIYSLGCVIFEALTGSPPFLGTTALETISMHANHELPDPEETFENVDGDLIRILYRCLEKRKEDRFANMGELIEALSYQPDDETKYETIDKRPKSVASTIILLVLMPLLIIAACFYVLSMTEEPEDHKLVEKPEIELFVVQDIEEGGKDLFKPKVRGLIRNLDDSKDDVFQVLRKELSELKGEIRLDLSDWEIEGAGLKELEGLNITKLNLADTEMSNCRFLSALPVKELILDRTPVTDDSIKEITKIKSLRSLSLRNCKKISERGFQQLKSLKELKKLNLDNTSFSEKSLTYLVPLRKLKALSLSGTKVDFKSAVLKELPGLNSIEVNSCEDIDRESLKNISSNFPELTVLGLAFTGLKSGELEPLSNLHDLSVLNLISVPIKDSDMKKIAKLKGLRTLYIGSDYITDQSLNYLAASHLNSLGIFSHAKISESGLRRLRSKIRGLNVFGPMKIEDQNNQGIRLLKEAFN